MVSVWISQENALVQNLAPNGTFFAWEMIKKTHHQHKSIKFDFDFTKSFEYSDEWPTNPGISDTVSQNRYSTTLDPFSEFAVHLGVYGKSLFWSSFSRIPHWKRRTI
jgi:hypothetical protein